MQALPTVERFGPDAADEAILKKIYKKTGI
jgi:hypothetical protein